ncbi:hypothetical protein [Thermus sp.]|jgi:hypothetical protein|uniref:hypothetical protein n=1 Tax=Thermus sp. TaxID=275 RepID=UPI003D0BC580
MALALVLLFSWAWGQVPRPLTPEEAFAFVRAYLGQGALDQVYKFEYGLKKKEGWMVYEFWLPGVEVWLESGSRKVVLYRPRKPPKHLGEPHLPFPQALSLVRSRYGEPWKLELKPKPKEGLLVWEAKGPFGEVWLDAARGKEVLRR